MDEWSSGSLACIALHAVRACVLCVRARSKFAHGNIVKLVGACFDSRPYYVVLELLDGGDLKAFLRQVRPRQVSNGAVVLGIGGLWQREARP